MSPGSRPSCPSTTRRGRAPSALPSPRDGGEGFRESAGTISIPLDRREGFRESVGIVSIPLPQSEGRIQRERGDCFHPYPPVGGKDPERARGLFPSVGGKDSERAWGLFPSL